MRELRCDGLHCRLLAESVRDRHWEAIEEGRCLCRETVGKLDHRVVTALRLHSPLPNEREARSGAMLVERRWAGDTDMLDPRGRYSLNTTPCRAASTLRDRLC